MKIIKRGKTKGELKAILNKTKRFECKTCGCIFEANKGEYTEEEHGTTYCVCPNCDKNAFEVKMEKIERRPETCYETSCVHYMFSNRCELSFPPGTAFDGLTGSKCPYYTRREEALPGAFSERDKE